MIVFRTDANSNIGFGHLTRCRVLARALTKSKVPCVLVGPNKNVLTHDDFKVFISTYDKEWTNPEEDVAFVKHIVDKYSAKSVVLDDYRITENYQSTLRKNNIKFLKFEAKTDANLFADLIINTNPAVTESSYIGHRYNQDVQFLLGSSYSLLREQFSDLSPREPITKVKNILITFGGGNDRGAILFCLSALLKSTDPSTQIVIMSGQGNPNNSLITEWIKKEGDNRVQLKINPENVLQIFLQSDIAIMAGGTTTYEAACTGLPMFIITIADNQLEQAKAWDSLGAAKFIGAFEDISKQELIDSFSKLLNHIELIQNMSSMGKSLVDGYGAYRVANTIIQRFIKSE